MSAEPIRCPKCDGAMVQGSSSIITPAASASSAPGSRGRRRNPAGGRVPRRSRRTSAFRWAPPAVTHAALCAGPQRCARVPSAVRGSPDPAPGTDRRSPEASGRPNGQRCDEVRRPAPSAGEASGRP